MKEDSELEDEAEEISVLKQSGDMTEPSGEMDV